jgi:hypothetical protein
MIAGIAAFALSPSRGQAVMMRGDVGIGIDAGGVSLVVGLDGGDKSCFRDRAAVPDF